MNLTKKLFICSFKYHVIRVDLEMGAKCRSKSQTFVK